MGYYWVFAEIICIEDLAGWAYLSCAKCFTKVQTVENQYWCKKCNSTNVDVQIRHKLTIQVADSNGTATFQVWEREIMQILNKTKAQLEEYGNINEIPKDIEDLVNKTALFKVQVREGHKQGYTGSYSVCKIIDDKDEVSKYCDYYNNAKKKYTGELDVKIEKRKVIEGESNENESEGDDSCSSTVSPQLSESPATKKIRKAV